MGRREGGPPAGPGGGWGASAPDRPSGWETQDPLSPTRRTAVPGGENTESRPPRKPRLCPDGTGMRTCRGSPPRVSKGAGRWGRPQEWYRGQAPHIPRGAPLCVGSPLAVAEVMEGSSPCQLLWHPGPVQPHPPTRAPHPCPQGTVLRTRRKGGRKGSPAALPSPQLFSPPPPAPEPLETPRSGGAGSTGAPGRAASGGQGSATSRTPHPASTHTRRGAPACPSTFRGQAAGSRRLGLWATRLTVAVRCQPVPSWEAGVCPQSVPALVTYLVWADDNS